MLLCILLVLHRSIYKLLGFVDDLVVRVDITGSFKVIGAGEGWRE